MIRFSFSSFYMSLLFANLMIMFLYLAFRNQKLMIKLGLPMLSIGLCLTILRMLLPFEFLFLSHNIYLPESVSMILGEFMHAYFFNGNLSGWSFIKIIWLIGIVVSGIRCLISEFALAKSVEEYSQKLPESASAYQMLRRIQLEFPKTQCIDVRTLPSLHVPMIFGLRNPHILLPKDLTLNDTQLYYILRHEITHYLHHDMLLKIGVKLLCIIYWWNPFCKLLQEQVETILEMRIDQTIAKNPIQKIEYFECLLFVVEHIKDSNDTIQTTNAISFHNKSSPLLNKRFSMLLDNSVQPLRQSQKSLLVIFLTCIFALSFLFILEASSIPLQDTYNSSEPNITNSYFLERNDGKYDFYLDGEYIETVDSISFYPNDIQVYKKEVNLP